MDFVSTIISVILFALFVPGAVFTIPTGGSKATVFVVHAALFAITTHFVMKYYWSNIRGYVESMGNYGATCPNGYVMTSDEGCVPLGRETYNPGKWKITVKQMWVGLLLKAILFMIMVPGVHLNIPPGASLREKALIHGVIFAVLNYYVYLYVRPMLERFENPNTKADQPCPEGYKKCGSGDCVLKTDMYGPCPESSFAAQ